MAGSSEGQAGGMGTVAMRADESSIREAVRRVVSSSEFASSPRMARLLDFVVERALAGREGELKEYLLGVEVFDRRASFDPRIDPIVRVEARRLRAKLKRYYETDGGDDAVRIEIPTGAYVPHFRVRGAGAPPQPAPAAPSIAALPFTNLSAGADSDYFSDGLTEELIHALTKIDGLRVIAWNTAARMKDRLHDFQAIGRELRVGTILHGSVRRSDNRIRITAKLVETESGAYLWSETYDRHIQDVFDIQAEISAAIVGSLKLKLFGAPAAGASRGPYNLQAYDLYLRGRFEWNKRTPLGLKHAIQYFSEAIGVDPDFAPGHAGLADAYSLSAEYGVSPPTEVMSKAKAAALRALAIDPRLAEAHTSLGQITSLHEWNWPKAGEYYGHAIELNPGYVTAHHWYACDYLALLGRFDEAVAEIELALRLDPLSSIINESVGYVLMLARRYDQAIERNRRAIEIDPLFYKTHTAMGRIYIHTGRYAEAVAMLEKGRALAGDIPTLLGALGQALALRGDRRGAHEILTRLAELARTGYVPSTCFALIHAGLGETSRALDYLETACDLHELPVTAIKVHPGYDALRGEPRFAALLRRLGLDA